MNAVDAVRELVESAKRMGYEVREEWLGGAGCAVCQLRGKSVVFVDAACSVQEQWEQLREVLGLPDNSVLRT